MATHQYDLSQYTYVDVKITSPAQDVAQKVLDGAGIAGMEFIGQVGELPNHLLYRIPKSDLSQTASGNVLQSDEERNQQVVTAISAVRGVVHVEVQVPQQRFKKDEL
ncbi:hypothetical protein DFQ27_001915 [Actinomortierella ambigua]|uniref:Uncharacterized protein n=1 Tax=Actinomortierella ambigua TaxID=1343610 RepID=A0A9P6Q8Q7_9FUNG|nr:hypothetical protein DFQ26_003165 [Actinomortierella ambigua]KAG0263113.1 hypothetical protein DFQ27_001915 [Actinomortierella ambigua]